MQLAIFILLMLALVYYLLNQVRKPTRYFGQLILRLMNSSHAKLTDWGLMHMFIKKSGIILDIGCGGGRTIRKLSALASRGKVFGVDYAKASIITSTEINADLIRAGKVVIQQASVSQLPFPDNLFDLVTAIETHYYWPNLNKDLQEILRVLKPGGTFLLLAENYKEAKYDQVQRPVMKLLKTNHLSVNEHRWMLTLAGFTDIQLFEEKKKGWLCAAGNKAENP